MDDRSPTTRSLRAPGPVRAIESHWRGVCLVAALTLFVFIVPLPLHASPGAARTIDIEASSYEFTPGVIRVGWGETIEIRLESSDVGHGLYLDGYDVRATAEPGRPGRILFTADHPGVFRFRCSVACGSLHPFMIGKLIVGPNVLFWRAAMAILIVLVGGFWLASRKERARCATP